MRFELESKTTHWIVAVTLIGLWGSGSLLGQAGGARSAVVAHLSGGAVPAQAAGAPQAPSYSLLYSFQCGPADGDIPDADLARDSAGNLYGTTLGGGQFADGTVYKVTPAGAETVLHSFSGQPDGENPQYATLTLDAKGNLYGVTPFGGQFDLGAVFKLTPDGAETVLYSFTDGLDGGVPSGGLVRDGKTGNLYGTAQFGGAFGDGVVFELTPSGKETVIYTFGSSPNDGNGPNGGLARDSAGNVYGLTDLGGADGNNGTVFEVSPSGTETILHSFAGPPNDGSNPQDGDGLLRDSAGNLYGATAGGGPKDTYGVVFKVTAAGAESVLLNFNGFKGGNGPEDGLAEDPAGNLYGTTVIGGSAPCGRSRCGVLFRLSAIGKETILHDFAGGTSDGANPSGGVIRVGTSLYGTTLAGGASGCGAVFKYTP